MNKKTKAELFIPKVKPESKPLINGFLIIAWKLLDEIQSKSKAYAQIKFNLSNM